tara:strand:+ start:565 stop:831 length:267 start_codon:yes stop_codon:yes gene_type:complete
MNKKRQHLYEAGWKEHFKKQRKNQALYPLSVSPPASKTINEKFKQSAERTKSRLAQRIGNKKPKANNPRSKQLARKSRLQIIKRKNND